MTKREVRRHNIVLAIGGLNDFVLREAHGLV